MPDAKVVQLGLAAVKIALDIARTGYLEGVWSRTDKGSTGLQLRVEGHRATWMLRCTVRGKSLSRVLGEVLSDQSRPPIDRRLPGIQTTSEARVIAREVRERFAAGLDVSVGWLANRRLGRTAIESDASAVTQAAKAAGAWTYETLAERYITEKVGVDSVSRGAVKPWSARAVSDTRRYILCEWTAHMNGRLVRDPTRGDLERARDLARATGAKEP